MKIFYWVFLFLTLISCNKSLDLSTIELGETAEKFDLNQYKILQKREYKGYYIVDTINGKADISMRDNGILTTEYFLDTDESTIKKNFAHKLNYAGIPIDSSWGTKIIVYKNKIASLNIIAKEKYALDFADKLLRKLGKPTEIVSANQNIDKHKDSIVFNLFHKVFPAKTYWINKETQELSFPNIIIWNKGNKLHVLTLTLDYNGTIRNMYFPITQEAYHDHVVFGYHIPPVNGSPLAKYLR
ncbi:hypothetical protein [Apibacter adventoris]|uniref:Lipoprotein n=1 Tax=Apibacter adventoris TaxID=1679466 RepID=A0A2S8ACB6_9FLAO|nr:hypothetical protein [Apibacter adventoris]PQL92361.1 hypothetical protein C4S77_06730 [Apibacter adventoris]